jgi:glyoxylase-like metal-dependent hydrolase (beta-lactamase superfamily II)
MCRAIAESEPKEGAEVPMKQNHALRTIFILAGLALFAVLASPALVRAATPSSRGNRPASESTFEVYAIRYGTLKSFPLAGLVKGEDQNKKIDIALMIWLIRGNGRNILVDSGFYRDSFMKQWKPAEYMKPSEAISKFGLKPEDITDIIISHAHWDHCDGTDLFSKARVWIQKEEFEYYNQPEHQKGTGVFAVDMAMLEKIRAEGRLELVDGDDKAVLPGITVYTGGRHTYASQYVGVNTSKGIVILASDNVYLYENIEKSLPIPATFDAESNLRAQERMKKLAGNPDLIIPGHDPAVFVRFPKPGNGIALIS